MPTRLLLALLALAAPALAAPAKPPVADLRAEATALQLVQSVLGWYTRTVGEPAIQAETYRGHGALFAKPSIDLVGAAAKRAKDDGERRALSYFKSYLVAEHIAQAISRFDDEAQNAELAATVKLTWIAEPVPYKQLEILVGNEADAARRNEIEARRAEVWKGTLNPILERKEKEAQRLAKSLGYRSYVALAEEFRAVELRRYIVEGERLRQATDELYGQLLTEVAAREMKVKPSQLRRADIARLRKAPRFARFFPKELMIPSFQHFLDGVGLSLKTVGGATIRIDDAMHPQKEPRAACYSIRVPDDIRITVKPTGGLDDFVTFFHEGGHALHYANATTKVWELQQLGPYALTEGLAETFGHVWDEPGWLRRYRAFVERWNQDHKTSFAVMTDADIVEVVHQRIFDEVYFLRRYASAKLIYESALHGGDPALWRGVYGGPTGDLAALYRDLFSKAYGFALDEADGLRFRTDVDDLFYAADYSRAFGLANLIHEGLRAKLGPAWFEKPAAGAVFKELAADGNRLLPDEVAKRFGYAQLDFAPSESRWQRLLGERAK